MSQASFGYDPVQQTIADLEEEEVSNHVNLFVNKQTSTLCHSPLVTKDEKAMLCEALNGLIDKCTIILGWCFSAEEVQETKISQWEVTTKALAKMDISCR